MSDTQTPAEAKAALLAAIDAEELAITAVYAADDAEPFDQERFDEAMQSLLKAGDDTIELRRNWYVALGSAHNPTGIRYTKV